MGNVLVTIKIMPESPETNMEKLAERAKEIVNKNNAKFELTEIEPIAFGLKALKVYFVVNDGDEGGEKMKNIEKQVSELEHIQSSEVIDVRRTFD